MRKHPVPMTKDQLVVVLEDILVRVKEGDSFEGSIEYLLPEPPCPAYLPETVDKPDIQGTWCRGCGFLQAAENKAEHDAAQDPSGAEFMVQAAYRIGNATMGQGSLRMIGELK